MISKLLLQKFKFKFKKSQFVSQNFVRKYHPRYEIYLEKFENIDRFYFIQIHCPMPINFTIF